MRMVLKYSRSGAAKYISHLDMQRMFGRAVRRARLPVLYSQGFNPHIIMSFASPLSVGYATMGDYLEIGMEDGSNAAEVPGRLNDVLTDDVRVTDAFAIPEKQKKLMALNDSALWRIYFKVENNCDCDRIKDTLAEILRNKTCVTQDRRGKEVDIRPLIEGAEFRECGMDALLKNASSGALNPAVLANAVLAASKVKAEYEICRVDCLCRSGNAVMPFAELKDVEITG